MGGVEAAWAPSAGRVARRLAGLLTGLAVALGASTPAHAQVTIGPGQIVVQGDGASAVITRAPFGIAFQNADGATVLSEAPSGGEPFTLPPSAPGTPGEPAGPALYAPLTFLAGSDEPLTFGPGPGKNLVEAGDVGNLKSDQESGVEYSAQEVIAAQAEGEGAGEGVRMTVSTDDPQGVTLSVRVTPAASGAIRVQASPSEPVGVAAMADSFASPAGEAFHGFGGRHNALDQRGQDFANWVDQENIDREAPGPEEPESRELIPNGPQAAYYVQSSFISSAGYGFMLARNELSRWRMDSERPDAWQAEVAAPSIDYVVAPGSAPKAIATLTSINGRQRVPPQWALGPLFDREVEIEPTPAEYQEQFESDIKEMVRRKLVPTAYRIEGFGFLSQETLQSDIAQLKALGIRPLLYFRPFVGQEKIGTEYPGEYKVALEDGYLATDGEGGPYIFWDNFGAKAGAIDFTDPAAVAWWKQRIDAALDLGAEGFMLDFGEQIQSGMHFADGRDGDQMHNAYPVLVQRVTREITTEYEQQHPNRTIIFFTRAGYSGEPGSAAYESFNFPGDETTDWNQASGLPSLTKDMLNRAIGGAYGYGTDIGGYYDLFTPPTTKELFDRWAEWAALTPVFRLHGAIIHEHTPWAKGIGSTALYRHLAALHVSAEPLIETLWKQADETGVPITRPLWLEHPDDPQAVAQEQEWQLGPDVLVAPVVQRGVRSRGVYFPEGCWRNPATGQEVRGPRSEEVPANLKQIPFFFRCGTQPFTPPQYFAKG